jgi:hypothetical protein
MRLRGIRKSLFIRSKGLSSPSVKRPLEEAADAVQRQSWRAGRVKASSLVWALNELQRVLERTRLRPIQILSIL